MDLTRRLSEHRAGKASRYTRSRLPVDMVWWRETPTWSAALREEVQLKRLRRAAKEELVRAGSSATAPDPASASVPEDVSAP
jgi:putative endonuclease